MVRAPCCSKVGLMRGPWSAKEDALLTEYIRKHGEGQWRSLPKKAGLLRCGKSCRLRWMNYLRPGIVRGNISEDEEDLIVRLHGLLGNRWSLIAGRLPGRTDNEIKNYWNTCLLKKLHINAGNISDSSNNPKNPRKYLPKPAKKSSLSSKIAEKPEKDSKKSNGEEEQGRVSGGDKNRVKVYFPKAVRLCSAALPRNGSFESLASGGGRSAGAGADVRPEVIAFGDVADWCGGGDGDDFLTSFLCGGAGPISGEEMDVVYDEYLQLLQSM